MPPLQEMPDTSNEVPGLWNIWIHSVYHIFIGAFYRDFAHQDSPILYHKLLFALRKQKKTIYLNCHQKYIVFTISLSLMDFFILN